MNSMLVTCSTSFFERLLFAARNPCSFSPVFSFVPASSRAWVSNAMPLISASTARPAPASSSVDSWRSLNSTAGMPAGV
jgi:hypothetical protein